jgi:competence protein ComEC
MVPLVHTVFGTASVWQMLSPLLSLAFVAFYPLMLFLHFIGAGYLCDGCLSWLFRLPADFHIYFVPMPVLWVYLILSLLAARYRMAMLITFVYAFLVQFVILL